VPAELIFDIDECGFNDWEERKAKTVLIPARVRNKSLHHPVDCQIRYQTLICWITSAGDSDRPILITPDRSVT
jgi:hypothetical protein